MADNKDKKGDKDKNVLDYYLKSDGDKADFEDFWKIIRTSDYDLDFQDEEGKTALIHAADTNNTEKAWVLLEFFADPDIQTKDGKTALHFAAQENRKEFTFLLLLFGADPTKEDVNQVKPFDSKSEEEVNELTNLVNEYKNTFIFMTRKRRKLIRHAYKLMESNGTGGTIELNCISSFYQEVYKMDPDKANADAQLFIEQTAKHKLEQSDKENITFEDFFISLMKIAKTKGMETLDKFLNGFKAYRTEQKRIQRQKDLELKKKDQAS